MTGAEHLRVLAETEVPILQDVPEGAALTEVTNITVSDEGGEEAWVSLGLFTQILLLFTAMLIGHVLEKKHFLWLGEAGVALLLGVLVGVIIRFASKSDDYTSVMAFDNDFFFLVLLPPIIFEAGFSLNVDPFLDNIGAICTFAFAGTLISTLSIGAIMWGAGAAGMCYKLSFEEASLFGAIISATDPVTVLSVFNSLGANIDLYSIVFGESVLNDAVAIVLTRTIMAFLDPENNAGIGSGILSFFVIFLGSMICGIAIAVIASVIFKTGWLRSDHNLLESISVILFAFISYMIAESFKLSGIVSILFCGMVMAKYTRPNLTEESEMLAIGFFRILSGMAETFVFIYIGTSLWLEKQAWDNGMTWAFLFISLAALAVSRALNVYPLSAFVNCMRPADVQIPMSHQHMVWFSGLRGAIAFALSIQAAEMYDETGRVFLTTTFFIILCTVLFNGGLAAWLLQRMDLLGGPTNGVWGNRRYQNLDEPFGTVGTAASMQQTATTEDLEMTSVRHNKASSSSEGDDRTGLSGDGISRRQLSSGSAELIEEVCQAEARGNGTGASTLGKPATGTSVLRTVSGAREKVQQLHSKVREINGRSLSEKLDQLDRKYISKYLVGDNKSPRSSSPTRHASRGGSDRPGADVADVVVDVQQPPRQQARDSGPLDTSHSSDSAPSVGGNRSASPPEVAAARGSPTKDFEAIDLSGESSSSHTHNLL